MLKRSLYGVYVLFCLFSLILCSKLFLKVHFELSAILGDGFVAEFIAIISALTIFLIVLTFLVGFVRLILKYLYGERPD